VLGGSVVGLLLALQGGAEVAVQIVVRGWIRAFGGGGGIRGRIGFGRHGTPPVDGRHCFDDVTVAAKPSPRCDRMTVVRTPRENASQGRLRVFAGDVAAGWVLRRPCQQVKL
jgi:hypothetical protein